MAKHSRRLRSSCMRQVAAAGDAVPGQREAEHRNKRAVAGAQRSPAVRVAGPERARQVTIGWRVNGGSMPERQQRGQWLPAEAVLDSHAALNEPREPRAG